jgi:hypothetical protein
VAILLQKDCFPRGFPFTGIPYDEGFSEFVSSDFAEGDHTIVAPEAKVVRDSHSQVRDFDSLRIRDMVQGRLMSYWYTSCTVYIAADVADA